MILTGKARHSGWQRRAAADAHRNWGDVRVAGGQSWVVGSTIHPA
jgi:hypothetical protein